MNSNPAGGFFESPAGTLYIQTNGLSVTSITFREAGAKCEVSPNKIVETTQDYLEAYFQGYSSELKIPLEPKGTSFQLQVWKELQRIPIGKTIHYAALAAKMGGSTYSRAVAAAIAANPILILIPCHRVLGKNGSLTGYSGGLERKKYLLQHESSVSKPSANQLF